MTDQDRDGQIPAGPPPGPGTGVEAQLAQWRSFMARREGLSADDVDELEDHLLATVEALSGLGLDPDEAFLVAVKRLGRSGTIAREFAREHSERLWKQLVLGDAAASVRSPLDRMSVWPMLAFAVLAGLSIRIPVGLLTARQDSDRLAAVLIGWAVLGLVAVAGGYAAWLRRPVRGSAVAILAGVIAVTGLANLLYPFQPGGQTQILFGLHAPIALAVTLGVVYLGSGWRRRAQWLDWVRFLGEFVVYYVLIALVGGALMGLAAFSFEVVGLDASRVLIEWVAPLGIGGAVIVAAWLVEAKKSVVENMAPVLAAVFTPLVTLLLVAILVALVSTGPFDHPDRNLLIAIDLLLVVVWGLVLFQVSARPPDAAPGAFDWLQWTCLLVALVINTIALATMTWRISDLGASANKLAALGENILLAVNLAWAAWLQFGFLRGRRRFAALGAWQAGYLPVIGGWALLVALLLPPLFGFV